MDQPINNEQRHPTEKPSEKERKNSAEIQELLAKSDSNKEEKLFIDHEGDVKVVNEINDIIKSTIDDPVEKYKRFYFGKERLLKMLLGRDKKANKIVREEINIFLNRGKGKNKAGIRGADSRMSYLEDIQIMVSCLADCVVHDPSLVNVYNKVNKLNKDRGYNAVNVELLH